MIDTRFGSEGDMASRAMPPQSVKSAPESKTPREIPRVSRWRGIVRNAVIALFAAELINTVIFFVARGVFRIEFLMPSFGGGVLQPITILNVLIATAIGVFGASIVYALILKFVRRPELVFQITSFVILIFSFSGPFSLPGEVLPAAKAVLAMMHGITAIIVVTLLIRSTAR